MSIANLARRVVRALTPYQSARRIGRHAHIPLKLSIHYHELLSINNPSRHITDMYNRLFSSLTAHR
mgnify:CR=1 FL=1